MRPFYGSPGIAINEDERRPLDAAGFVDGESSL